ncbi:MAG TPA: hypothetical protein VGR15_11010 [Bacteroidota bacterium]|jgi:photosystem II stability/assembly factor-like uncharacterized protein|nr:hypothetical protein [Bacteroidota bacterium]
MKLKVQLAIALTLVTLSDSAALLAQVSLPKHFGLGSVSAGSSLPPSNSVSQINVVDSSLWIGTSKGLAKSANAGRSWEIFRDNPAFSKDGIFAVTVRANLVWAATGYEKEVGDGSIQTGAGYAFSTDDGGTWQHVNQTLDLRGDSIISYGINDSLWILPVVVPEQNVTFDVTFSSDAVWIASWASGLRRTTDFGQTWQRIPLPPDNRSSLKPTDTLWTYAPNDTLRLQRIYQRFDPRRNNNFLAFSVHAVDVDTIWCGTAGGVNKSTDGGSSWVKFNHQNQVAGILGNWVIAIDRQRLSGINRVWTTNWRAEGQDEQYGVSYTDDGGRTWTNLLHGVKAYDFAFKDSVTYIASDEGVYRTKDGGMSFAKVSSITDPTTRQSISSPQVFSVNVLGDTVFVGTADGLASTVDNSENQFGASWKIYRSYQQVGNTGNSYAYPNPFAPGREVVRIHYLAAAAGTIQPASSPANSSVNIDIFDFGMNRVRTLARSAARVANEEQDEIWDGRNEDGRVVANGVYFYRVKIGDVQQFGKILVLQ